MSIRVLFPLLFITALLTGEDPDNGTDVTVALKPMAPDGNVRLGYSTMRPLVVEATVPRFVAEIPKFNAANPLFFRVALGETKGIPFFAALDRSKTGDYHDLLYIDRNRDFDLTNDGEPIKAHIRTYLDGRKLIEFLGVTLPVPYSNAGGEMTVPYPCIFYYVSKSRKKGVPVKTPLTVQVERDGWRQGSVKLGDKEYQFALIDDDCDGNYTTGDTWSLNLTGKSAAEMLVRDATRSMLFPSWSVDQKLTVEVKSVDLAGRKAVLRIKPAKETESAYFLRVAMARQTPEERMLKLDPMRPKADAQSKVKWLEHKDGVRYALGIANSPNVKKRVLLDFTGPRCIWCARMYKYTFADREVMQLTEKFVCAKIPFQKGAGDSNQHDVEGTPTYIILALDGSEIARQDGFLRPTEFAAWIKAALR